MDKVFVVAMKCEAETVAVNLADVGAGGFSFLC